MKKILIILVLLPIILAAINNNIPENNVFNLTKNESNNKTLDHKIWNDLLEKHVSQNGIVNYKGFKKDLPELKSYLELLSKNSPENTWNKNAILAYWINAYNAYTVKLIIDNYTIKSIKKINNPWNKNFINIGNKTISLGEIEHKILRKLNDPRIHFAINCASYSCPNLSNEAFTEKDLNNQLNDAAKSFINDKTKNNISANTIEISNIFDWFSIDFKTKGTLIDFLNTYSNVKINPKAKISYKKYNWELNE